VNYGKRLPDGAHPGSYSQTERLLHFFSISDIHITDKESPVQLIYTGINGTWGNTKTGFYSPVMMSTTHVLDAAVQTINALHTMPGAVPFDFGISLGDAANNNQYNELRWYVDTLDGKRINPSSGAHKGAQSIDYQMPYQTAGLDKSISWYQVIGNHDQYYVGTLAYNDYARRALVGSTVIDMGFDTLNGMVLPTFDGRGTYMGVLDGASIFGNAIDYGADSTMAPPIVAPDPNRRALSTNTSTTLNWMKEFFNTTSQPKGHGFTQSNIDRDFASYSFEPKAGVPVKVIVLDDTCKINPYSQINHALGCLDQARYDWLVNELELGQAQGKLMIIAAHVPVGPQWNTPDAPLSSGDISNTTIFPVFFPPVTTAPLSGSPVTPLPTLRTTSRCLRIRWLPTRRSLPRSTTTRTSSSGCRGIATSIPSLPSPRREAKVRNTGSGRWKPRRSGISPRAFALSISCATTITRFPYS